MQLRSGERLANMFIQTVCAVGLHMLGNLSSLVCKASSDYLAGQDGVLWRGSAWWNLGCHWMLWAEWLDLDDNLGQRKEVTPFHGFESMQPCSLLTESLKVAPELRIETLERFSCSGLRGIY
jgi:hypothetical protein